jgi:hypothetical protein
MGPRQWFADKVQEWRHMGATWRFLLITVTVLGTAFIVYQHVAHSRDGSSATVSQQEQ